MKWSDELQQITREYQSSFEDLSEAQLNWKPNAQQWSVGQIIDHVITTNAAFFPVLAELKAGTYQPHFNARFGFLVNFFGNLVLGAVQPEAKRKVKTAPVFEPRQSQIPADILVRFKAHQARLEKEIESSAGILEKVVSSPMNRAVVYRVGRAFEILVAHERRHLQQAKGVLALLKP